MQPDTIPDWLKKEIALNIAAKRNRQAAQTASSVDGMRVHTVCREARCPNMGRCFSDGEATFLIMGNICTRGCAFCAVTRGKPAQPDPQEPAKLAKLAAQWGLKYAVITSPTRDDLPDGGASCYAQAVRAVQTAGIKAETLTPDFKGDEKAVETVLAARPAVFAHNIETVPSLYASVRSGADYRRSLKVLSLARAHGIPAKSGLMLGLGETEAQVLAVMDDMLAAGCEILTLGQYLRPSKNHYPVRRYLEPAEFQNFKEKALAKGFKAALSAPLVRSSYLAESLYQEYLKNART